MKYKRVLFKLSGEAIDDPKLLDEIAMQVKSVTKSGAQVAIVVGGGNIIRGGVASQDGKLDRSVEDYMGMLATVINALALTEAFKKQGIKARTMSAVPMERVCDTYKIREARKHLENGEVVILGGGTGVPFFTTDTNASLKACELQCDAVLKATKVDGVYDSDPIDNPDAKKFDTISFEDVLARELRVMDLTAISMCMDNNIPVIVFNMNKSGNLKKVLSGEKIGTKVG